MPMQVPTGSGQSLGEYIRRQVRLHTNGLIQELRVEVLPGQVVLSGRTSTYYAKQLATHAALGVIEEVPLTNDIEVI